MKTRSQGKEDLIKEIISRELKMFLRVPTARRSPCQEHPEGFELHRRAQFSCWSEQTLRSYLNDLERACGSKTNLMTQKYARMDNLILKINASPLIDTIVAHQCAWQCFMMKKYPGIMSGGRPLSSGEDSAFMTSFETYLKGELETYSDATLELLNRDIEAKHAQGINMAEEIYTNLIQDLGYDSLDEAEQISLDKKSIKKSNGD